MCGRFTSLAFFIVTCNQGMSSLDNLNCESLVFFLIIQYLRYYLLVSQTLESGASDRISATTVAAMPNKLVLFIYYIV